MSLLSGSYPVNIRRKSESFFSMILRKTNEVFSEESEEQGSGRSFHRRWKRSQADFATSKLVLIRTRVHPFPFRTR